MAFFKQTKLFPQKLQRNFRCKSSLSFVANVKSVIFACDCDDQDIFYYNYPVIRYPGEQR